ncbi:hypothetical protein CK203_007319 [Vitis vinifera]|uniref:Yippee domain-containing protein n=1 Tax=Vitis vinifera TaxID=29760 RepID=A0A438G1E6_VITVI|nr:hypothetical protein CK203_007319 [Vitis vinifera]
MGRLFLVEFDQTPEVNFYCCRTCQAHIVLAQHCFSRVTSASLLILLTSHHIMSWFFERKTFLKMEQLREGLFRNVVNVVVDERTRREGFFQVEDIHCVRCNKPLGWRYIPAQPNGTVLLKLAHLLFWDGARLLNADTLLDPVVDQENQEDHDQENQEDHDQENQEDQGFQGEEDEDDQGPDDNVDID